MLERQRLQRKREERRDAAIKKLQNSLIRPESRILASLHIPSNWNSGTVQNELLTVNNISGENTKLGDPV